MIRLLIVLALFYVNSASAESKRGKFMTEIPAAFEQPKPANDYDKNLLDQISKVGWFNVHIAAEEGSPAYAFTVGHFHKQNHPEIVVMGLPARVAHELLNTTVIKIVGAKQKIEPYKKYRDFTESLSVAFVPVEIGNYSEWLGDANWYYESLEKPYPVLQMVWPDKKGLFPWEDGYDKRYLRIQPLLGKFSK